VLFGWGAELLDGLDLAACDGSPDLLDLVDDVDAIRGLGVLLADVQVEMAAETARGEGLAAEGAVLVLGGLEGGGLLGFAGRGVVGSGSCRHGHGHGRCGWIRRRAAKA